MSRKETVVRNLYKKNNIRKTYFNKDNSLVLLTLKKANFYFCELFDLII